MKRNQNTEPHRHARASLSDNKCEYIFYVVLPGMRRSEIEVNIHKKELTVSAVRNDSLHGLYTARPALKSWKESFRLPADADTLMTAAVYHKGELEIHIPKGENIPENHIHRIHVY
ncbi:MAG TPA: Hsp20/alpha crystallin family protein [Chitinophagaceae bacterium]|jgi:HSP20 family molecular chaperone IbpA|nr:Hsp20/alpha crystallin family protein [Chitinophagaceae bacterium]HMU58785.1 Hsp20/alpha crystallin family protein [Chitinophagaceae bacterium]